MAEDYQIRRAGPADDAGVARELAAYFRFLGEEVDAAGLDHDVADWQTEYDGAAGVMLIVIDPAGRVVGTEVERVEVEPLGLHHGPLGNLPAHRHEHVGDPLRQHGERVPGTARAAAHRAHRTTHGNGTGRG